MREIRESLTVCSTCKNCKLVVWDLSDSTDKLEKYEDKRTDTNQHDDLLFIMRCGWLKQNIVAPHLIVKCEGKQRVSDD